MEGQAQPQPQAAKPLWEQWGEAFVNYSLDLGNKIADGAVLAANYIAEKSKPATDKIKEGASYVGNQMQAIYDDTKAKITGVPPEQVQPLAQQAQEGQPGEAQNSQENQEQKPIMENNPVVENPPPQTNAENSDNAQNTNTNANENAQNPENPENKENTESQGTN